MNIVNADKDMTDIYQVVFLPDYSVSLAELLIPASDISLHISTAGTEVSSPHREHIMRCVSHTSSNLQASGTSNMKVCSQRLCAVGIH